MPLAIRSSLLVLALLVGSAFLSVPTAKANGAKAAVTVVHGVPGLDVDVYVNGDLAIPGFTPGTVTDALPFDPGTYDLAIVGQGGDPASPVLAASATLAAGDNVSIVAHLDGDGSPKLTIFANDVSRAGTREGRVVVRHTAAAPTVDVKLSKKAWRRLRTVGVLQDLSNGDEASADVRARRYVAQILPANESAPVVKTTPLRIRNQEATIVYAIGSLADGTFQLLIQNLELTGTKANVSIVHGVLGLTVDVYVNGDLLLPGFVPKTVTDALELAPGTYDVAIVAQGGDPATPAIAESFDLTAGQNVSLVAHLDANGTPTLSAFANDVSKTGYAGRVSVRHAAEAPAVDAYLMRRLGWFTFRRTLGGIENGEQGQALVWPGRFSASVTLAGQPSARVLGPAPLNVAPCAFYAIYAVGSAADGTLDLIVQMLPLR